MRGTLDKLGEHLLCYNSKLNGCACSQAHFLLQSGTSFPLVCITQGLRCVTHANGNRLCLQHALTVWLYARGRAGICPAVTDDADLKC